LRIFFKSAALVLAALILLPYPAFSQGVPSGPERILFDSANREREAQGLTALRWDDSLADAARRHAAVMAKRNTIAHQFPGEPDFSARAKAAGARFSAIAENVAEGPAAEDIHASWMKSPPHRRNLLDPELDSLGVAVASQDGQLFAVEDFSRAVSSLSLKEQESRVSALLEARRLRLHNDNDDARHACSSGAAAAGQRQAFYLLRYSATDLDKLPQPLEQKIQTGEYHEASVGACLPAKESPFSTCQMAVVLYEGVNR